MKTYNHAFTVAFSVSGSRYEDPDECLRYEQDKVIAGMLRRAANLVSGEDTIDPGSIEPFDTYEELGPIKEWIRENTKDN
jgi:hypothetical protein